MKPERSKKIRPDRQDRDRIEREHGPLRPDASIEEMAHRYRLAQAAKLIRIYGLDTPKDRR